MFWCPPVPEPSLSLPTRPCPFTGAWGAQQDVPIGTGRLSPACASCHQRCPLRRGWSRLGGCGPPLSSGSVCRLSGSVLGTTGVNAC